MVGWDKRRSTSQQVSSTFAMSHQELTERAAIVGLLKE